MNRSKEPKICKCGHLKNPDHKYKWYVSKTSCKKCQCHEFLNRKYGSKFDSISTYLVVGISFAMSTLSIFTVLFTANDMNTHPEIYSKTFPITFKAMFDIMNLAMLIFFAYMSMIGLGALSQHRHSIKRITLPIDDGTISKLKSKDEIIAELHKTEKGLCEFYHSHPEVTHEPELEMKLQTLRWILNQQSLP